MKRLISIVLPVTAILLIFFSGCSITGKNWEADYLGLSIKIGELEADLGKDAVIAAIDALKDDEPDKFREYVKSICETIDNYEKASAAYAAAAKSFSGVPNLSQLKSSYEAMSKSFKDRAEEAKKRLAEFEIECP